jgi:hypothetical protein
MVAKAEIVAAIDTMVKGTHKEWRVGVTNELADHDQFLAERPRWGIPGRRIRWPMRMQSNPIFSTGGWNTRSGKPWRAAKPATSMFSSLQCPPPGHSTGGVRPGASLAPPRAISPPPSAVRSPWR